MSESLERSAELAKLARLLDVDAAELAFLGDLPSQALSALREQVTDRLYRNDSATLRRIVAASRVIPLAVTVRIAPVAVGPRLCGALAGLIEPDRAARMAARFPIPFLADVAEHLDPRRTAAVIAAIPPPIVVRVARQLLARGEHVTMGRFVTALPRATLAAAAAAIRDDADLLRVAFVMEGKDRLDDVVGLARDRFAGLVRAAYEHGLWIEALDLVSHLGVAHLTALADVAAAQDDDLLTALVAAVREQDLWDVLLPAVAAMSPAGVERLAGVPVPLTAGLPDMVSTQPVTARLRALQALASAQRAEEFAQLLTRATADIVWDALLEVRHELPEDLRVAIRTRAASLNRADVVTLLTSTHARPGAGGRPRPHAPL